VLGLDRLPLPVGIAIAAGGLVAGIFLSFRWELPEVLWVTLALVAVFVGVFLYDYSGRALLPPTPVPGRPTSDGTSGGPAGPGPIADDGEEFLDPVIEADRIASGEVLPEVVEEPMPSDESKKPEAPAS
jgi:hypothetical protein